MFWEQTLRACQLYLRATTTTTMETVADARVPYATVLRALERVLVQAETRSTGGGSNDKEQGESEEKASLRTGGAWIRTGEFWLKVAKKVTAVESPQARIRKLIRLIPQLDDFPTMQRVTGLLTETPSPTTVPPESISSSSSSSASILRTPSTSSTLPTSTSSSRSGTFTPPIKTNAITPNLVVARAAAALALAAASVERSIASSSADGDDVLKHLTIASEYIPELSMAFEALLLEPPTSSSVGDLGKAYKALERVRRSAIGVLHASGGITISCEAREKARETVLGSVGLVEGLLARVGDGPGAQGDDKTQEEKDKLLTTILGVLVDLSTSSVDTLLSLAKADFDVTSATTPSLAILTRAVALRNALLETLPPISVNQLPSSTDQDSPPPISAHHRRLLLLRLDAANLARCISGTAYNCAGLLYRAASADSSPSPGRVVGFLELACREGDEALRLARKAADRGNGEMVEEQKPVEGWTVLKEGMSKRWELLGTCLSKQGEYQVRSAFPFLDKSWPSTDSRAYGFTECPCRSPLSARIHPSFDAYLSGESFGLNPARRALFLRQVHYRRPGDNTTGVPHPANNDARGPRPQLRS